MKDPLSFSANEIYTNQDFKNNDKIIWANFMTATWNIPVFVQPKLHIFERDITRSKHALPNMLQQTDLTFACYAE
jgi:hypothetical protein